MIQMGDVKYVEISWTIPTDVMTGTYKVRAMAWSGWLPDGVALAPEAYETSFTVT
jgi:hypothetical protein